MAFINARAALVGPARAALDPPLTFDTITVQITGLDAYAGIGPIKSFTSPASGQSFYEHPWQVEPNRTAPRPGPTSTPGSRSSGPALRAVRNDLSHGTKGYPTLDLHAVVQILERVTRAHMLRVLGCGTDAQLKAARGDRPKLGRTPAE